MPIVGSIANASAKSLGFTSSSDYPVYMWIIVGNNGNLWTSTSSTASSWTSRTSSFGSTDINSIASNGKDLFVAVGAAGKLATSPDGINWVQQTSSFGTTDINNIAYGADGYWVATGAGGKIATSQTGIDWTQRTSGTSNDLYSVAYGNGLWLVGENGNNFLRRATDPTSTWTATSCTLSSFPQRQCIYYAKSQAIWVIGNDGGTTGAFASSTDGISWTARTSAWSTAGLGGAFISNSSVIAFTGYDNILNATSDVESSTNGTTWTNRTLADSYCGLFAGAVDASGLLVFAGNDYNTSGVSVGVKVQSSSDGTTWTTRTSPSTTAGVYGWSICHSVGLPSAT